MIRHDRDAGLPSLADLTKADDSGPAELVEVPVDPWGSRYEVVAGTKQGTFEAVSPGPDRRVGTADDIRHVGLVRPR